MTKMNKRHIFILAPSLAIGGAERVLVNLLKKIDYERFHITLCLFASYGTYFNEIPPQVSVSYIFRSTLFARCLTYLQLHYGIAWPIRWRTRAVVKDRYDVGVCFSDGTLTDILLFIADRFNKTMAWVHSCYKSQHIFSSKRVKCLKSARYDRLDHIVFVSRNSEFEFSELFGPQNNHSVIYNLFDGEIVKQKSEQPLDITIDHDVTNIITIGRMVSVKQYDQLISAVRLLIDRGLKVKLRIIGDGNLRTKLRDWVKYLQLEQYVDFLGFKSNPYPHLKHSDILAISSLSEAFPTVMIEAMMLSTAVVATKCKGCIEISDNGQYALLSDHSVESIADCLSIMIENVDLRNFYIAKAKARVLDYDEQISLNNIYQLWEA